MALLNLPVTHSLKEEMKPAKSQLQVSKRMLRRKKRRTNLLLLS